MQRLCRSRACEGRRRARKKRVDAEAIQIKGRQGEEKSDNNESEYRGCTDNKESGYRVYTYR